MATAERYEVRIVCDTGYERSVAERSCCCPEEEHTGIASSLGFLLGQAVSGVLLGDDSDLLKASIFARAAFVAVPWAAETQEGDPPDKQALKKFVDAARKLSGLATCD